jgi:hypothetical protein
MFSFNIARKFSRPTDFIDRISTTRTKNDWYEAQCNLAFKTFEGMGAGESWERESVEAQSNWGRGSNK